MNFRKAPKKGKKEEKNDVMFFYIATVEGNSNFVHGHIALQGGGITCDEDIEEVVKLIKEDNEFKDVVLAGWHLYDEEPPEKCYASIAKRCAHKNLYCAQCTRNPKRLVVKDHFSTKLS